MSEVKIRLGAQADLGGLEKWSAAVAKAREELRAFTEAQQAANALPSDATGGGGGVGPDIQPAPGIAGAPLGGTSVEALLTKAVELLARIAGAGSGGTPGAGGGGGGEGPEEDYPTPAGRRGGGGWLGRSVSGGLAAGAGFALGGSIAGFFISSVEDYLRNSSTLARMGARFGGGTAGLGAGMGYTIGQTAPILEALGGETNTVGAAQFNRLVGLGRSRGLEGSQAAGLLGRLERLTGAMLDGQDLAGLLARADSQSMGRGRLGEFLGGAGALAEQVLRARGSVSADDLQRLLALPQAIYGDTELGRGQMGQDMIGGIHGALTSGGPMRTFLLRAMGLGREDGPSYEDAMVRLEAGVNDPRNLRDLLGMFDATGMGRTNRFLALTGSGMSARQARDLLAAQERGDLADVLGGDPMRGLDVQDTDFAAAGRRTISLGESAAVELEGMRMDMGATLAPAMVDLRHVAGNLVETMSNLVGQDLGGGLSRLTGAVVDLSEHMKSASAGADRAQRVLQHVDVRSWKWWTDPNWLNPQPAGSDGVSP